MDRSNREGPSTMTPSTTSAAAASLDALSLRRSLEKTAPAGIYVAGRWGRILHQSAFGTIGENGAAPDAGTSFRIASCTKSFTAALILILRDAGQIELDRAAEHYYPELRGLRLPGVSSAKPTIRMLLSMSAGLATDNEWADRQESLPRAEFDELIRAGVRFSAEPGTRYEYSNLGYAILGRVAELVTGTPYIELVADRLLGPLGLAHTGFDAPEPPAPMATGHARRDGQWVALDQPGPGSFSAIGGIYSTGADLASWSGWLQSAFDTDADDAGAPLSAASRREMQQIQRVIPQTGPGPVCGYGYGLGIELTREGGSIVSHSGGYPGFSSHMRWHVESGWFAVGFENATYSWVCPPVTEALDIVLGHEERQPEPWPETTAARALIEESLAQGSWLMPLDAFTENVAMDLPFEDRRRQLEAMLRATGPLDLAAAEMSDFRSAADISWSIPGTSGALKCTLRMSPLANPRIQALEFARLAPGG